MKEFSSPFKDPVWVLPLAEGDKSDVLLQVPLGSVLRFTIPPPLHGSTIQLKTNHPLGSTDKFERSKFREVKFTKHLWDDENYAEVRIHTNGTFIYEFNTSCGKEGKGYFAVHPVLRAQNKEIDLNSLSVQTVLMKCLGPLCEWNERLATTVRCGYNAIHFTPVQELGASQSSYSLKNQLVLNPTIKSTYEELGQFLDKLQEEHGVLSFCDLVLNHTANETPWLVSNPESTYNLLNSPHLRPAYLLDAAFAKLSLEIGNDEWENYGVPKAITKEEHIDALRKIIHTQILPALKIEQFFMVDIEDTVQAFKALVCGSAIPNVVAEDGDKQLSAIQDPEHRRFSCMIDWNLAINIFRKNANDLEASVSALRSALISLNEGQEELIRNHLSTAVENVLSAVRYERLDPNGPRYAVVSPEHPFVCQYFERISLPAMKSLEEEEKLAWSDQGRFIMAHNGWVMGDDPLRNFAEKGSEVYLRRELIAWGDSVKLRYGQCPEDSPFLWKLMREYTEKSATIFHGLRLDNCHSTPIHVAEHMLDAARNIRPNLYVFAELFTNSDVVDNIFVNRLGITSLIREALNAWNPQELGRLVHRFGGHPVGAFQKTGQDVLQPSIPRALFMDQTHDNQSPIEKRSLYDCLPTAALVAMASCATGSNRGFDELVPHHIHVVSESRPYSFTASGIINAKAALNNLHRAMGSVFNQLYVDQHTPDIVAVTRHAETTAESIILLAYSSFGYPQENGPASHVPSMNIGVVDVTKVYYQARLISENGKPYSKPGIFEQNPNYINGLDGYKLVEYRDVEPNCSQWATFRKDGRDTVIDFADFRPGDILIIHTKLEAESEQAMKDLNDHLRKESVDSIFNSIGLAELNKVLYRCDQEERDDTNGQSGVYDIPKYGPLVYCGIQGIVSVLGPVRATDDLGHPLCDNLRAGDWLMEYTFGRLLRDETTVRIGNFVQKAFEYVKLLPRNLIPRFFDIVIMILNVGAHKRIWQLMSDSVQKGSPFMRQLALATLQVSGESKSGYLPFYEASVTLSAGLPHFSTGYMRNWGRDTFIALPGVYLTTGRLDEAVATILSFASVLRHGLIPNLLDKGTHARYNCRDATWFWLNCIVRYCNIVPEGESILQKEVYRMYPTDDSAPVTDRSVTQTLEEVMYEALLKHFNGIKFRERNAGTTIDAHMKDEGFNIEVKVDKTTGFPCGGNRYNCGTWMDKMGSSDKANNRGIPATPRDGAPVEIVALAYSVMRFLDNASRNKKFRFDAVVEEATGLKWTWENWHQNIKENFEKHFWIGPGALGENVHRRNIYKDTVGSTLGYTDYQLRPNYVIAMGIAEELFSTNNALAALESCKEILLGPLGLKTLDPEDWNYNGFYDNSNDSTDTKLAHGYNYHNGPEWVWPVGYYIRSYVSVHEKAGRLEEALSHVRKVLANHIRAINESPWKGLTELTNKDGALCHGSCPTQAWSAGTILEALHDLRKMLQ